MGGSRLEVHVEGRVGAIPARAFLEVLRTSLDVLEELDRAERGPRGKAGRWLIAELRNESATAVLRRDVEPDNQIASRLVAGIGQLHRSDKLPSFFSPRIATDLAKIGSYARRDGVTGVQFRVSDGGTSPLEERVNEAVVTNALASVEGVEHAVGSVAGLLDVINLRRGAHKVSLYDDESRRAVKCRFPDGMFTTVKDALGHRVRALGELTRNRRGQVLSVQIEQIEVLADLRSAPSVDDLAGLAPWYTGDVSSDEFIRSMRHE